MAMHTWYMFSTACRSQHIGSFLLQVNDIPGTLTWGSAVIAPAHNALPKEGVIRIKLQDVIRRKSIKDIWRVGADADPESHHFVEMELQWLGILVAAGSIRHVH